MDATFRNDIMKVACKMSNLQLNEKIDELLDIITCKDTKDDVIQEAKDSAAEFARVLNRRGYGETDEREGRVACGSGCCA